MYVCIYIYIHIYTYIYMYRYTYLEAAEHDGSKRQYLYFCISKQVLLYPYIYRYTYLEAAEHDGSKRAVPALFGTQAIKQLVIRLRAAERSVSICTFVPVKRVN
jgi:hypothetical protein